jgi:hypothetical protein
VSDMAAGRIFKAGPRAVLAGDGALIMAAACAVLAPLASLLEGATFPLMAVGLLAPLLAWRLHGRRVDGPATGGAVLGYLAGVGLTLGLLGLLALVMLALSAAGLPEVTSGSSAGNLAISIVIVVMCAAVALWLCGDAVRDLSAKRREHVWLDVARFVATVAIAAYFVGVLVSATGSSGFDSTGAVLSVGGCGVVGAAVVTAADLMVKRHEQQAGGGRLLSGV